MTPSQNVEERQNQSGGEAAGGGHGLLRWAGIGVVALALYILSVGPAAKLVDNGVINKSVVRVAYAPLLLADEHWLFAHRFLRWYVKFWVKPFVLASVSHARGREF
jgi:hypothetical protein